MFWRISRILNLDICCLIGCHLLLIVGGGGHQFNRAISDQYEGSCPPAVPGLAPGLVAAGYQCYCSRVRRGERCGHQPSTSLYVVARVVRVSCTAQWCQYPMVYPARAGMKMEQHCILSSHTLAHTGTSTGHGVTAAQPGQLSIGRGECIVMRHCHNQARAPRGIRCYQWLNKAKWDITPSQAAK